MNRWKGNAVTQITLDEDFIVPDTLEDMEQVILEQAHIQGENVKTQEEKITVKAVSYTHLPADPVIPFSPQYMDWSSQRLYPLHFQVLLIPLLLQQNFPSDTAHSHRCCIRRLPGAHIQQLCTDFHLLYRSF